MKLTEILGNAENALKKHGCGDTQITAAKKKISAAYRQGQVFGENPITDAEKAATGKAREEVAAAIIASKPEL
jgi:hypothetical protein